MNVDKQVPNGSARRKCAPYVVAFVDVLGASESIRNESGAMLNVVYDLYEEALRMMHKEPMRSNLEPMRAKVFSDNILFAYPMPEGRDGANDLFPAICCLTQYIGIFQTLALSKHLLLWGGVSIGDLYIDELMVWGSGLLRAYELESQVAVFPRILVDHEIVWKLDDVDLRGGRPLEVCKIAQDSDLLFYIDYLKGYKNAGLNLDSLIASAYNTICQKESGRSPNKISQKLSWQVNYMSKYLSFDLWQYDKNGTRVDRSKSSDANNG